MDATIRLDIPWQGVRMRTPADGRHHRWAVLTTSRGTFVLTEDDGAFTARPLVRGGPRPGVADDDGHAGFVVPQQSVELARTGGGWRGRATLSGHEVSIEDDRP